MIQTRLPPPENELFLPLLVLLLKLLVQAPNHWQLASVSREHPYEPNPDFNPHIGDTFLGTETLGTSTPLLVHQILADVMV